MRSPRKTVVIGGVCCFLGISLGAWFVYASQDHSPKEPAVPVPVFWSDEGDAAAPGGDAMLTHGGWFCANPQCRFLKLSGGSPFRSAKSQACSLCREPLVTTRSVAVNHPVTEPEGG